jgi:hypothetical protein
MDPSPAGQPYDPDQEYSSHHENALESSPNPSTDSQHPFSDDQQLARPSGLPFAPYHHRTQSSPIVNPSSNTGSANPIRIKFKVPLASSVASASTSSDTLPPLQPLLPQYPSSQHSHPVTSAYIPPPPPPSSSYLARQQQKQQHQSTTMARSTRRSTSSVPPSNQGGNKRGRGKDDSGSEFEGPPNYKEDDTEDEEESEEEYREGELSALR